MKETGVHKNNGHNGHNGQYERFFSLLKKQRKKLCYFQSMRIVYFHLRLCICNKTNESIGLIIKKYFEVNIQ